MNAFACTFWCLPSGTDPRRTSQNRLRQWVTSTPGGRVGADARTGFATCGPADLGRDFPLPTPVGHAGVNSDTAGFNTQCDHLKTKAICLFMLAAGARLALNTVENRDCFMVEAALAA